MVRKGSLFRSDGGRRAGCLEKRVREGSPLNAEGPQAVRIHSGASLSFAVAVWNGTRLGGMVTRETPSVLWRFHLDSGEGV